MIKPNDFIKLKVSNLFFFLQQSNAILRFCEFRVFGFQLLTQVDSYDSKKLNENTAVDHYAYNHEIHITLE